MKRMLRRVALLGLAAAALGAVLAWPRINAVETGKTPEYPELQPRHYSASVEKVTKAAKAALAALPRWRLVGEGKGPEGAEIQALYTTLVRLEHDVVIRIRHEKGRTQVSVKSKSRTFDWDFGQNARNIRTLLAALDREIS
ncbi:MAG TPA: DUF1499 domain-containing protein [Vicinamibacteria bacterium]|nr:DUF1499 domain-containing protein [Vicinamibacteria bacterium]